MNKHKGFSCSPNLQSHENDKSETKFKTPPKQEKTQILELTIDLRHPATEISQKPEKDCKNLDILLQSLVLIPKVQDGIHTMSNQLSPKKRQQKAQTRNCKTNTIDNPRKIYKSIENPAKVIYTEPSYSGFERMNKGKSALTNAIYTLEDEIKAHAKAVLDRNFSTAFTPNSKQTEEDFESEEIFEGGNKGKRKNSNQIFLTDQKFVSFMDSDAIYHMTELSKNVKYVNGGVGIADFKDFFSGREEKNSFVGISLEENPMKNQIKAPFSPVLLFQTNNSQKSTEKKNTKFLAFLNSLPKKST